jgi:primosomal protein N''
MQIEQAVTEVLNEAIQALTALDLNKLESLEQRIAALAGSSDLSASENLNTIQAKKRLLELILQNCRSNLNALDRLHGRNTRNQWAH